MRWSTHTDTRCCDKGDRAEPGRCGSTACFFFDQDLQPPGCLPDAKVLQYNANNFGDSAAGAAAAKDMITKGADVIYHAAGGTGMGVIEACNEEGIWAIGVDTDQSNLAPDHVLTSAMKRVDTASQDISKSVKDGNFTAGVHLYDLSNNGVGIAPTTTHISDEVLAKVKQAMEDIGAGKIVVPTVAEEVPEFTLAD